MAGALAPRKSCHSHAQPRTAVTTVQRIPTVPFKEQSETLDSRKRTFRENIKLLKYLWGYYVEERLTCCTRKKGRRLGTRADVTGKPIWAQKIK